MTSHLPGIESGVPDIDGITFEVCGRGFVSCGGSYVFVDGSGFAELDGNNFTPEQLEALAAVVRKLGRR